MTTDEKCPEERCIVCDGPTGRAGIADDSFYRDLPNGESHGPLCGACDAAAQPYIEYWQAHVAALQAIVDKLPKTADGVSIVPGVRLFWGGVASEGLVVETVDIYDDGSPDIWVGVGDGTDGSIMVPENDNLYSTREAAEEGNHA